MFAELVYKALQRVPRGKVTTYSSIAKAIGRPEAARSVGNALNKNPHSNVPCHRVVRANGEVGGFAHGTKEKIRRLKREGVPVLKGKVPEEFVILL